MTVVAIASVFGAASTTQAAVLAQYAFDGQTNAQNNNAPVTSTLAGVSATNLIPNDASLTAPARPSSVINSNYALGATAPYISLYPNSASVGAGGTPAAAVANGSYHFFTLSVASGALDLSDISLWATKGGAGTRGFVLQSSADNYTTDILSASVPSANGTSAGGTANFYNPTLSGAIYDNLTSITFRIYVFTDNSGRSVNFDDITVNGDLAAVPEPSSLALASLLAVATLLRKRRAAL